MFIQKIKEKYIKKAQSNSGNERIDSQALARINNMLEALEYGDPRCKPSKYWVELIKMNLSQLQEHGFENFKKTIALNYFTWVRITPWDSQIIFLVKNLPLATTIKCCYKSLHYLTEEYFSKINIIQSILYGFLTHLLWEFCKKSFRNHPDFLDLQEPTLGNPPLIKNDRVSVSQDLLNSLIETKTIIDNVDSGDIINKALELGAGYGRNAFVWLSKFPNIKYTLSDLPPV